MRHFQFSISNFQFARAAGLAVVLLAGHSISAQTKSSTNASRTIGIEGRVTLDLPRGDYRPRPLDDRTELILRIESVTATNRQQRYEFSYMGMEPGDYRLADYLVRPDGSRADELSNTLVHVQSVLPENHDGKLTAFAPGRFPFIGGYRIFLALLGALWLGGIGLFIWSYRKKRVVAAPAVVVPEPSFAERMRPLVEAAAAGKLSLDGQAQLERLFIGFWREKLNPPGDQRMADALAELKAHAQAGELLRALEHWLHERTGATAAEVNALLEPYRQAPSPQKGEGGAA